MRTTLAVAVCLLAPFALAADPKKGGVKSVEAKFEPAEAKPGQTVTLKLTVTLEDGYYTYPLVQTDKAAAGMVNKVEFPKAGAVVFVGDALDPANPKTKAEPVLGITEMLYYTGTVVYERTAVVNPSAKAGEVTVELPKFLLSVCDKDNCFPAKKLTPSAKLKIADGPAAAVDKKYAAEVEKALQDK
jgi:Disulphide bond corrector protein DsbC